MTGIIIGRFQTPYLHPGHLWLISTALRECHRVVILLGEQDERDSRNPYNLGERADMIRKIFPQVDIKVLRDRVSDEEWSKNIDNICEAWINPVLYHSRDSFKDSYSGKYPLKEVKELPGYSATKIRNNEIH